jgi:diguanylate cyclase (GGDEF)-like protein
MKRRILILLYALFFAAYFIASTFGKLHFSPGSLTLSLGFAISALFLLLSFSILRYSIPLSTYFLAPPLLVLSNLAIQLTGGIGQSMFVPLYFIFAVLIAMKSEVPGVVMVILCIAILETGSAFFNHLVSLHCFTVLGILAVFSGMITSLTLSLRRKTRDIERELNDMKKTTSILSTPVSTPDRDKILGTLKDTHERHDIQANEKMKEFVEPMLNVIHQTIQSHSSVIFLKENNGNSFVLFDIKTHSAYINREARILPKTGVYNWVLREKEPLLNNQFLLDATLLQYYTRDEDVRSVLMVPLLVEKEIIGLLICDNKQENSFDWEHKEKLKVFGNLLVSIVLLFKNLYWAQWQAIRFRALHDIARRLSESLEMDDVLTILTDIAPKGFDFDLLAIVLCTEKQKPVIYKLYPHNQLRNLVGTEISPESSLTGLVIKNNQSLIKPDKISTPVFAENERGLDDFRSFFGAPLHRDENVSGVLVLLSKKRDNFPEDKKEPVLFLANLIAVALEKAKLYAETKALSIRDGLTNAFNHRFFQEKLTEEVKRAQRSGSTFSLLMLDIDEFKKFNDQYGHQMGDNVLRHISATVRNTIREIDIFARYGGEEFIIILPETDREGALNAAQKIKELIELRPLIKRDERYDVTVSIGCATFPFDGTDKDTIIRKADAALYKAKKDGRNCVRAASLDRDT